MPTTIDIEELAWQYQVSNEPEIEQAYVLVEVV